MNTFDKSYFLRHYRSAEDKNPSGKLSFYRETILRCVPRQKKPLKLLDIGCGYGMFLSTVAHDFECYGIDPSRYSVREAQLRVPSAHIVQATLQSYRSSLRFDVITAFDVLEHLPDEDHAMKKIHSLLTFGGVFVCVVPVYDGLFGRIGGLLDRDHTHLLKWSRWTWLALFERNFRIRFRAGLIRYTLPVIGRYIHVASPLLWRWGQAFLVVMRR